jgi:glycosyltransferase involved in cell wall biosynthesis
MIVKNESHIIAETLRCLKEKVRFQYWVICDTGSTDGTQHIIRDTLHDIPGELHEVPWVDFGTNRTQAARLARGKADYSLMFDADDTIEGVIEFPDSMTADIYNLTFRIGCIEFHRSSIFRNTREWKYMCVLHEYLESADGLPVRHESIVGNYRCVARTNGARSKDPERFRKDAETLAAAFEATADPIRNRYAFYCANSWKDCGNCEKAIFWYRRTLELDGWSQEKYIACLRIYEMYAKLGTPELGLYALVESTRFDRDRAECLYNLINYYLLRGMSAVAFKYYELLNPEYDSVDRSTKLFVQPDIHTFLLPYTMIIVADRVRRHDVGLKMYGVILRHRHRPNPWYLPHLFGNAKFFPGIERYAAELQEYARENGYSWDGVISVA